MHTRALHRALGHMRLRLHMVTHLPHPWPSAVLSTAKAEGAQTQAGLVWGGALPLSVLAWACCRV